MSSPIKLVCEAGERCLLARLSNAPPEVKDCAIIDVVTSFGPDFRNTFPACKHLSARDAGAYGESRGLYILDRSATGDVLCDGERIWQEKPLYTQDSVTVDASNWDIEAVIPADEIGICSECGHSLFPCSVCEHSCNWSSETKNCDMFQRTDAQKQNDETVERRMENA
ncbi:hypothetical protein FACS1894208_00620 [Clostridia bacterium]|nr:hypothetical protein FACS1894208_00620 [Clostridia bacterium]